MPSSHRRLVHRHRQRILEQIPRDLAPGEARLFSFYTPSLKTGLHTVTITQHVSAPAEDGDDKKPRRSTEVSPDTPGTQKFIVLAPKFALPADAIDSVFPAPGSSADHTILPHVVFRDPHLPWQRAPSHIRKGEDADSSRRRTPWVAVLQFTVDEVTLQKEQIDKFLTQMPSRVAHEQTETSAVRMKAQDTPLLDGTVINTTGYDTKLDARDAEESTDVLFLQRDLFLALFQDPENKEPSLNVSCYKFMAHVRQVATDGMAGAGADADEAMFSIAVSRRTGPIGAENPTAMVVHVLSLDWKENVQLDEKSTHVAVTSLYSWLYTCLPSKNVASPWDQMVNLGENVNVLRTQAKTKKETDITKLVSQRQADGYSLVRYRTVTGEETAAILRGPLTPTYTDRKAGGSMQSNFGSDLAIFDKDFGMLDITYATAWQLGKTLAMGDTPFCTALGRLRNAIHSEALDRSKRAVHAVLGQMGYEGTISSKRETAKHILALVQGLNGINNTVQVRGSAVDANRWCHERTYTRFDMMGLESRWSAHIASRMEMFAEEAALKFAVTEDSSMLYNEHGVPTNPDYSLVYSWILDKVHLSNVPAHYLIPDPAFLPQDTLRTFFIDDNWIDALIDGALSLANHWGAEPEDDHCRTSIKNAVNARLRQVDKKLGGGHVQMPRYGFLLRSQLLVQFPDLAVSVQFSPTRDEPLQPNFVLPANVPPQQPILVQKRVAPDTMYCLFDAAPPDLQRITFTMPSHQQCFAVGETLVDTPEKRLTVAFKKIYTVDERPKTRVPGDNLGSVNFGPDDGMFDFAHRTLNPVHFASYLSTKLNSEMGGKYKDLEPNSAVCGLQLNASILQLDIGKLPNRPGASMEARFQLSTPKSKPVPIPKIEAPPEKQIYVLGLQRPRPASPPPFPSVLHPSTIKTSPLKDVPPPLNPRKVVRPKLDIHVYPVRTRTTDLVPCDSELPIDLVFKLRPPNDVPIEYVFPLTKILVGVPYGKMPSDEQAKDPKVVIPLLADTADPPTPHMVSNMRLNVLKRWGTQQEPELKGHVVFELIPRTLPGMPFANLIDASFRLPRAQITEYTGIRERFAYVRVLYEFLETPPRATFSDGRRIELKAGL